MVIFLFSLHHSTQWRTAYPSKHSVRCSCLLHFASLHPASSWHMCPLLHSGSECSPVFFSHALCFIVSISPTEVCNSVYFFRRQEKTVMKLVVDAETDRVLGASMCGPDAPEIIQVKHMYSSLVIFFPSIWVLPHSSLLSYDWALAWSRALLLRLNVEPPKRTSTALYVCLKRPFKVKQVLISCA